MNIFPYLRSNEWASSSWNLDSRHVLQSERLLRICPAPNAPPWIPWTPGGYNKFLETRWVDELNMIHLSISLGNSDCSSNWLRTAPSVHHWRVTERWMELFIDNSPYALCCPKMSSTCVPWSNKTCYFFCGMGIHPVEFGEKSIPLNGLSVWIPQQQQLENDLPSGNLT